MKKYIFAIILGICTLAEANFYLKGSIGLNNIKTVRFTNHDFEGQLRLVDAFPLIEAGIGYNFVNGIRIESVINYYFLFRTSETSRTISQDVFKITGKTKTDAMMFNIYKNLLTIGKYTPFAGGGIGVAWLKESAGGYCISQDDNVIYPLTKIVKKGSQFVYKLSIGTDIKFSDTITGDISYNYFNLGSNKRKIIGGIQNIGKRTYEIHNIILGIRLSI